MTDLFLYDDAVARDFEPFALTRPVSELRAGAEIIRRRWAFALGADARGFLGAPHLADFAEGDAPAAAAGAVPAGAIVANSRCVVALAASDASADVWVCDGRVAAVRLRAPADLDRFADGALALDELAAGGRAADVAGRWLGAVWDLVGQLGTQLADDLPRIADSLRCVEHDATVVGAGRAYVEEGAAVEPYVVFDVSGGPVVVRRGASVQAFTRLGGPCYVGEGSTAAGDIRGCSIGEVCKVRGEISASVVLGHANKGHDGFVGHSYLGRWVNLGAGTTTSNMKNTYGTVALWTPRGVEDTGQQFLGTLFGDHAKAGIGLRLTTGCVVGAGANVYDRMPPKVVPPFAWGGGAPYGEYDGAKFVEVARRAMARRRVALDDRAERYLRAAHDRGTRAGARWPDGARAGVRA